MVKPGDLPPGDLRSSLDGGLLSVGVDGGLGEVLGDDFGVLLGDPRGDWRGGVTVDRLAGRRGRVGEGRDVGEVPPAPLAPGRNTDTPPRRCAGLGVGGLLESLGLLGNGFVTFRGDGDSISPDGGGIGADGRRAGSILGLMGDFAGFPRMMF